MTFNQRSRRVIFFSLLLLAFLFRLGFGLCSQFLDEDTKQIYLIGLKFYTTGAWPYFGPDVTQTMQVPGALQGLVVGLPFHILAIPEAPYIFLNVLSFASLCFFAWYCCKRLPELPRWFVWCWLFTAPWTLNISTHIFNPSYVLPGAILFFVGAIETYPFLSRGLIQRRISVIHRMWTPDHPRVAAQSCSGIGVTPVAVRHSASPVPIADRARRAAGATAVPPAARGAGLVLLAHQLRDRSLDVLAGVRRAGHFRTGSFHGSPPPKYTTVAAVRIVIDPGIGRAQACRRPVKPDGQFLTGHCLIVTRVYSQIPCYRITGNYRGGNRW